MSVPVRPSYGFPWIGQLNTPNYLQISSGIRNNGYPADAALPAADYNEIHLEAAQWIAYLDYYTTLLSTSGVYNDLGLTSGSVGLTGATGTVSIISGKYVLNGYNLHLEIGLTISSIAGTLTSVAITLPTAAKALARYENTLEWPVFTSDSNGPSAKANMAGFGTGNNSILQIGTSYNSFTGTIAMMISIDYEMNH